jgi:leucyl aminopeptidase (aminopeptidase T)
MVATALDAMIHVLDLVPEDRVLVVTDAETALIGEAFHTAAAQHGCAVQTYLLPEAERPLVEVPPELSEILPGHSVVLNLIQARGAEVPFRIKWILEIVATKSIRMGHAPGITEAMMTGGPLQVDYATMADLAARLMRGFRDAKSAHITTTAGTDLVVDIQDRTFLTDVKATVKRGSNLPCGEVYCGPVETGADGVLVIDGTCAHLGQPSAPVRLTIAGGTVEQVECADTQMQAKVQGLMDVDPEARVIGELGIGINPSARLVNNMLEDEKAFRTAHIAFGNNSEFPGGQNNSQVHHDFLFHRPTLTVTYKDGSRQTLLENGDFQV